TQLGFCRSSRRRRLGAAGDLGFDLDGTASGGFFLHAHEGSLGGVLIWCKVGCHTFRGKDSIQSEIAPSHTARRTICSRLKASLSRRLWPNQTRPEDAARDVQDEVKHHEPKRGGDRYGVHDSAEQEER